MWRAGGAGTLPLSRETVHLFWFDISQRFAAAIPGVAVGLRGMRTQLHLPTGSFDVTISTFALEPAEPGAHVARDALVVGQGGPCRACWADLGSAVLYPIGCE